jgi:hypothetical protein
VCAICQEYILTLMFMLSDKVWAEAGMRDQDNAQAVCLAVKLRRLLTPWDFGEYLNFPTNDLALAIPGANP